MRFSTSFSQLIIFPLLLEDPLQMRVGVGHLTLKLHTIAHNTPIFDGDKPRLGEH